MPAEHDGKTFGLASGRRLSVAIAIIGTVLAYFWLRPAFAGNGTVLACFLVASTLLIAVTVLTTPSLFTTTLTLFLSLGFLGKLVAHIGFGAVLTEPTGGFDGSAQQWNTALAFAAAGLMGVCLAVAAASRFPAVAKSTPRGPDANASGHLLVVGLVLQLAVAGAIYALNARWMILRIGYPPGIHLWPLVNAILSFIITWGAVLAALFLTQMLIDRKRLPHAALIYVACLVGVPATMTIGSRIQLLLYVLAAFLAVLAQWREVARWRSIALALLVSIAAFAVTLVLVSIERNLAFTEPAAPRAVGDAITRTRPDAKISGPAAPAPSGKPALDGQRVDQLKHELSTLLVMRWVGLEGVMTTAAHVDELRVPLFVSALREEPLAGTDAIYQHMSGDMYLGVTHFTFLTLPGAIGFASFAGSVWWIAGLMFVLVLGGHTVERLAGALTCNIAAASVVGVSLAYLVVQLNVPWTLFVYVLELVAALFSLAVFRLVVGRVAPARSG